MAECRRQRCNREAERASLADGQCIYHAQKYLSAHPVDHSEPKSEKVEPTPSDDPVESNEG